MKTVITTLESLACHTVILVSPTPDQQKMLDEGWIRYHRADGKKGWYKPAYLNKAERSKQENNNG